MKHNGNISARASTDERARPSLLPGGPAAGPQFATEAEADAWWAVGMSVASTYAPKNRRSGRAFGKMWDAVMIHRARGRLSDNNLSRAPSGGASTTASPWPC